MLFTEPPSGPKPSALKAVTGSKAIAAKEEERRESIRESLRELDGFLEALDTIRGSGDPEEDPLDQAGEANEQEDLEMLRERLDTLRLSGPPRPKALAEWDRVVERRTAKTGENK